MLRQRISQSLRSNDLLLQVIIGCAGLMLGIACIRLSPLIVLGGVAVASLSIYATLKKLEMGLLGILICTSSIVYEDQLPLLSLGSISFHIPDIILLWSLGVIAIRWVLNRQIGIARTPLDIPLLIFFVVTLCSTFVAVMQSSVEVKDALRATRVFTYYLTFFIVTNLVKEPRQLNFLLNSTFSLATIVAVAMIGQYLVGESVELLPGRIETLKTMGRAFEGVTRVSPPGFSIVLVSFVAVFCTLVLERLKPISVLKFLQCGLLGSAILITFLRSYWAVLIMVLFLLLFLVRGIDRQRLFVWVTGVILLVGSFLLVVLNNPGSRGTRLIDAFADRLSTLSSMGTFRGEDSSVAFRKSENRYAFSTIAAHPLIGIGMGGKYRPWDSQLDFRNADGTLSDFRGHIHNGHLWIVLQSGLLGYFCLIWFSVLFLKRGFTYWRSIPNEQMRGIVLGFTLAYLAVLIAAVVNSTFMQWRWTPVIGFMMGVNEVILKKVGKTVTVD